MTIWKYALEVKDEQVIALPKDAQILCVQTQNGFPNIWALVSPEMPKASRRIRIYGTGHSVDEEGRYVGTFQLHGGGLVFHVFEVGDTKGVQ